MAEQELVLEEQTFRVSRKPLLNACEIFLQDPSLLRKPYQVQSHVTVDSFRVFLDAIGGRDVEITNANASGLDLLCREFSFGDLGKKVSEFLMQHLAVDVDIRREVSILKEQFLRQEHVISNLQADVVEFKEDTKRQLALLRDEQTQRIFNILIDLADLRSQFITLQTENKNLRNLINQPQERVQSSDHDDLTRVKDKLERLFLAPEFVPMPSTPLEGIIDYLTKQCGGNVSRRNVVNITSSGGSYCDPAYIVDFDNDSCFGSVYRERTEDIPHTRNNWICYDFKNRRVKPTHYTLRSFPNGAPFVRGTCLKSWVIEVSVDGENWMEIDHKENNSELNQLGVIRTFEVRKRIPARFVRLTNIGRNHLGDDQIALAAFEIFGTLI